MFSIIGEDHKMCDSGMDTIVTPKIERTQRYGGVLPSRIDFAGEFNFRMAPNTSDCSINAWLFSEKLKKIFVDVDKVVTVNFYWQNKNVCRVNDVKFIRAMPVYTQDDLLSIPVEKCFMHTMEKKEDNADGIVAKYVLLCENDGTYYDLDIESNRRSCVTPILAENVRLSYKFTCKTSCYRGTQRRPTTVIFTLEDVHGKVLGRRCLMYKVCTCLKRDMVREEKNEVNDNEVEFSASFAPKIIPMPKTEYHVNSEIPRMIIMKSNEPAGSYSLKLSNLKQDYVIFSLIVLHNTLLGEYKRNRVPGTQSLIKQIEGYLMSFRKESLFKAKKTRSTSNKHAEMKQARSTRSPELKPHQFLYPEVRLSPSDFLIELPPAWSKVVDDSKNSELEPQVTTTTGVNDSLL